MSTIQATRMRKGMLVKMQNDLFRVLELQHVTPGNLRGFVRVKFRNIRSGALADQKLRSEDMVERATLDEKNMQYMYGSGDDHYFMDTETYDQVQIPRVTLEEFAGYLKDGMTLAVLMRDGEIVTIDFPQMVELEIVETEDAAARGDTARAFQKRAKVETGAEVMVPGFIKLGDRVKIDTTTGKYVERV